MSGAIPSMLTINNMANNLSFPAHNSTSTPSYMLPTGETDKRRLDAKGLFFVFV